MAKKFPDLSGDGKTTFKDVLIGRGVIKKKSFPDLSGDGKTTFKDILIGRGVIKKKKKTKKKTRRK